MNTTTSKYIRILDAQTKIYKQLSSLTCMGSNWEKEREQTEKLKQKNNEYENKLIILSDLITQEEFNKYLADRMCCSWGDFKN